MGVVVVSVTFASMSVSASSSNVNSAAVTVPSGTTAGDLLLLFAVNGAPDAFAALSGWTVIDQPSPSTDTASAAWYRVATSADTSTTTYSPTYTGTANPITAVMLRYIGVDTTQFPLAATKHGVTHGTTASTTSGTPPSLTVSSTDMVVRAYVASQDAQATGMTLSGAPTGWTQRGQNTASGTTATYTGPTASTTGFNNGMVVCDLLAGNDTATVTTNQTSMWDVYEIALPAAATPNVPVSTLSDNFDDNSIDTTKWPNNFAASGGTLPTETNGKATFNTLALAGYGSADKYKLAGSSMYAQVSPFSGAGAAAASFAGLTYYLNPPVYSYYLRYYASVKDNQLRWFYTENTASSFVFNVTTASYNPVTQAWLRVRESAGTLFFETSPDGITWTQQGTQPTPGNITVCGGGEVDLEADNANGTAGTLATIDNLNIAQYLQPVGLVVPQAVKRAAFR